ncbi:hypothetical protein BJY04DRAFT_81958 [Aspergillus karnatakaensis]|uniref:uncharacterized protein n=1 Tax=Aspergillus karnatakaensis TaxID=1810916 RepID=UPI003CCDF21E
MDISQVSANLSSSPRAFPNCCLSISTTLLAHLHALLPKLPSFTLSIGSGSGLLEALVTTRHLDVLIEGVEVNSSVNIYLAEQAMNSVSGTWDLLPRAAEAKAWMFVYPREPKLVTKYIERYGDGLGMIIWLGPRADWADYEGCFGGFHVGLPENVGVADFEMLAVIKKIS